MEPRWASRAKASSSPEQHAAGAVQDRGEIVAGLRDTWLLRPPCSGPLEHGVDLGSVEVVERLDRRSGLGHAAMAASFGVDRQGVVVGPTRAE